MAANHTNISVVKSHPLAELPQQATPGSAGMDITSIEHLTIPAYSRGSVSTGLMYNLPTNLYFEIKPRSGLVKKHNVTVHNGVIDSDYTGTVHVLLHNQSPKPFQIKPGDRIAQIVFQSRNSPTIHLTDQIQSTLRGDNGFGSTGISSPIKTWEEKEEQWSTASKHNSDIQANRMQSPQNNLTHPTTNITASIDKTLYSDNDEYISVSQLMKDNSKSSNTKIPQAHLHMQNDLNTSYQSIQQQNNQPYERKSIPVRPVDRIPSSNRQYVQLSSAQLYQSFAYRNIDNLLKHLPTIAQPNIKIEKDPDFALGQIGQNATIHKGKSNKQFTKIKEAFGDTIHIDIGYGSSTGIGGVKYCLFLVDRSTTAKYTYPLKDLDGGSIAEQLQKWMVDLSITPKRIRADCDPKLMFGAMHKLAISHNIQLSAAPNGRQNQNGLVERNWYTCVRMARSWLFANHLPSKFWFYALKRATELSNYFPVLDSEKITTPFELVHNVKPDFRSLFPMFSIAYVRKTTDSSGSKKNKFTSQTIKTIAVGKSDYTDGLTFYNPATNDTIESSDYRLDPSRPAGCVFTFPEEHPPQFYRHNANSTTDSPPEYDLGQLVRVVDNGDEHFGKEAHILAIPFQPNDPYTLQLVNDNVIHQYTANQINQVQQNMPQTIPNAPSWVTPNSKCTLYLPSSMPRSLQGFLIHNEKGWFFKPGRKIESHHPLKKLPNFEDTVNQMVTTRQLQKGFHAHKVMVQQQQLYSSRNIVAFHISAKNLLIPTAPSSLKNHSKLPESDKITWNQAYSEEYNGLQELEVFDYISEAEYQKLKHILGQKLPSIAIATIKYNADGQPERAKYRLCVLGNLDHHDWEANETFAPVLSHMELRLLISEAAKCNCVPKTADFKQAFCQSILPALEKYVITPPYGCPLTPPNTYLLLKKTLYGLKRSPRHWFDKAVSILKAVGLHQIPNSPCLFIGKIIEDEPPLILGLYVDDCIYYSQSSTVETEFERRLSREIDGKITFMGDVQHFLGIKFTTNRDERNNLSIFMSQSSFIETISGIFQISPSRPALTPYRSGLPVDKIPDGLPPYDPENILTLRRMVGSLMWLAQATRPDIATITNMLASYQTVPTPSHIDAAKRVIAYLVHTKDKGISFHHNHPMMLQHSLIFHSKHQTG